MIVIYCSVGGYDGQSFLDTVECYDPRTKVWSRIKSMTCRRSELNFKTHSCGMDFVYVASNIVLKEATVDNSSQFCRSCWCCSVV